MIAIRKKQTLFDYVYQNLREQIITGRLQYGVKLPSMTCLCDFYHVGIRTVKDVLRTLKEEGYIKTEERKAAVVIYRQQKTDEAIRSVLTKKKVILEVYQTLTTLMPWIFAFSAQFCDKAKLKLILENIEQLRDKEKKMPGVSFLNPLYELLDRSNNLLFRDLFANLEIYARMPFFQRYSRYLELIRAQSVSGCFMGFGILDAGKPRGGGFAFSPDVSDRRGCNTRPLRRNVSRVWRNRGDGRGFLSMEGRNRERSLLYADYS